MAKYIKKEDRFNKAPLEGEHQVSPDGAWVTVGNRKFKRTVLPSVAKPTKETQELTDTLENIDKLRFSESQSDTEES